MRNRILLSKSGTITDLSTNLKDYNAGSSVINLTTSDYLYLGQMHPFNHLSFKASVLNEIVSVLTVELWDGSEWQEVVETIDETSAFSASGLISWVPSKYKSWNKDDTVDSSGTAKITDMGDITIYDKYWARISVSVNITGTTALSWAGNIFCNDSDITGEWPAFALSSYMTSFKAGKTDWEEQRARAASIIIDDLIKKNVINKAGQIIDIDSMRNIAVSKTAEIIFNALGTDYEDDRLKSNIEYSKRMNKSIFYIDKNKNAILDDSETTTREGRISR